jgi:subtilisin
VKSTLRSLGNLNWNNVDDPDGIKERLLNVDAL